MEELRRLYEFAQAEAKRRGVRDMDELDRLRELVLPPNADWKITWPGRDSAPNVVPPGGPKFAHHPGLNVAVVPHTPDARSHIKMRVAVRAFGERKERRVLVAELNGVYLYVDGHRLLLTDRPLDVSPGRPITNGAG